MKKIIFTMSLVLGLLMSGIGLSACGGSDDDGNGNVTQNIVVGEWLGHRYDGPDREDEQRKIRLIFNENGSGTCIEKDEKDQRSSSSTFVYKMEGSNKGKIRFSGDGVEYEEYFFVIEGSRMSVYDDDYGHGIDWILTKQTAFK